MFLARCTVALALSFAALPGLAEDGAILDPGWPEGYPPKMGEVSGKVGDQPRLWETYDFSIGAFDGSAWAGQDGDDEPVVVSIMAFPPGEPDTLPGRIHAKASFGPALRTGAGVDPVVSILRDEDLDGPRLTSEGQAATLVIDSIGAARPDSYNRRVTGRIEARLCPVDWPGEGCKTIALVFDTDLQIGTRVIGAD